MADILAYTHSYLDTIGLIFETYDEKKKITLIFNVITIKLKGKKEKDKKDSERHYTTSTNYLVSKTN